MASLRIFSQDNASSSLKRHPLAHIVGYVFNEGLLSLDKTFDYAVKLEKVNVPILKMSKGMVRIYHISL